MEGRGYQIVEKNYWKPWGEIDIVAEIDDMTIFVEVKSVSTDLSSVDVSREEGGGEASRGTPSAKGRTGYRPEDNMHPAKVRRLHRAIQTYLLERKVPENREWRLDLACAYLDFATRKARVEVLENVVL